MGGKSYSYDDFDKFYPIFLKIRDPFLSFFDEIKYDNKIGEKLHDLYSDLYRQFVPGQYLLSCALM